MSFTGIVENDTIKLPPGVHLPDGTKVTVVRAENASFEQLALEEGALRSRLAERGLQFSAENRLSRDEVHDRHALR